MNGSVNTRCPVSFDHALAMAGAMGGMPGSPMPVGFSVDGNDVHLDVRHLVDAQHAIVVEVRLHDAPVGEIDRGEQRGRKPEAHASFELRADYVRVDRDAAVGGDDDPLDLRQAILAHRHLDNVGDERA